MHRARRATEAYVSTMRCVRCGRTSRTGTLFSCRDCGGVLSVEYQYERVKNIINRRTFGKGRSLIERFRYLLPIWRPQNAVSLGEGGTPLLLSRRLAADVGVRNFYLKDETRNPTGTFKDRAISVGVSFALQEGVSVVSTASTGNAAASLSAYSARCGLGCYVLLPHTASPSKVSQLLIYGAHLIPLKGNVDDGLALLEPAYAQWNWYPLPTSAPSNPYQLEGTKSLAYEVCIQLQWQPPDWLLTPIGGGDNIWAIWKGLRELRELGLIHELPSLIGVQAAACPTLVEPFRDGRDVVEPAPNPKSIASSICLSQPPTWYPALKAVRESEGRIEAVDDRKMLWAQRLLGKLEGMFAEPSSAAVIAALPELVSSGVIKRGETVVCIVTGTGLKDPGAIAELSQVPEPVPPTLEDVARLVRRA